MEDECLLTQLRSRGALHGRQRHFDADVNEQHDDQNRFNPICSELPFQLKISKWTFIPQHAEETIAWFLGLYLGDISTPSSPHPGTAL